MIAGFLEGRPETGNPGDLAEAMLSEFGKYKESDIPLEEYEPACCEKAMFVEIAKAYSSVKKEIGKVDWQNLTHDEFAKRVARLFPAVWQVHPFREGNTRTTVMMIALFVENYGYYFDYELMAQSTGYVRNAFVLCCFGEYSEYEHLEKILLDAISEVPIEELYDSEDEPAQEQRASKYQKYYTENYKPQPHEYIED